LQTLIDRKIEDLRHYNLEAIKRVVTILNTGRTGSLLLVSYLDGHDNIIMLPTSRSEDIYPFFEQHPNLSLWDKLIVYPFAAKFFQGDFAIDATNYYAALRALFEAFGNCSSEFLESRKAFFQFVHVAYSLALGRRPATPEPMVVHSQHDWNEAFASRLVEDFPQARFIHTVRDPIANFDRTFEWTMLWSPYHLRENPRYYSIPFHLMNFLTIADGPHSGMESRTRAIRFEDLHCDTAKTLGRLVDWLGIPFQACLLESTFNGIPYVVERNGNKWSGQRPEQAERHTKNISFMDRALIFALFSDNFAIWNYPCPKIFRSSVIRCITCMLLLLIPMKPEVIAASATIRLQVLPALRSGKVRLAMMRAVQIVYYRFALMIVVATRCFRRLRAKKVLLQLCSDER
jgi:hypothetical protein